MAEKKWHVSKISYCEHVGHEIALETQLVFPSEHLPEQPPRVVARGYDKVVHTSLFTVMGIAAQAAAPWISLAVTLPVAVGLELVQRQLPYRMYDNVDLLANLTGILLGLASFELSTRLVK